MIVMFQGTNVDNHGVTGAASIAAIMSAAKYNRKTLYIQLTNADANDAEEILIGKRKQESLIRKETLRIEDKGIDALIRRAETSKLIKQNFDNACEALINFENMLDLASVTKKVDFEINLTVKDVRIILHHASDIYDNIFILLNGKNTTVMQEVLELADCVVTCIGQTPKKEPYNTFEGKRELKLVADYENSSQFSAMYLKKLYAAKKIYMMMHNSGYRDACLSGTLLEFVLKNMSNSQEDENFLFIKHLISLMEGIMDKEDWTEKIPEPVYKDEPEREKKENLVQITEDDFYLEEKQVKKKLFRKKMVEKVVVDVKTESVEDKKKSHSRTIRKEIQENPEDIRKDRPDKNIDLTQEFSIDDGNSIIWICPSCGEKNTAKFCAECGTPKPIEEEEWVCPSCGIKNKGKFCSGCGRMQ